VLTNPVVLSAAAKTLNSQDPDLRAWAATAVSRFGPLARGQTAPLMHQLLDPDYDARAAATNTLLQIAPEAITNSPPQ
jgi:HEAT repeat protein